MKIRKNLAIVMNFLILSLILTYLSTNALPHFAPPVSGDWIIDSSESISDASVTLNGSIVIKSGGTLTLSNVDLTFAMNDQGATDGEFNITVQDGGTLIIENDCYLTTDDPTLRSYILAESGSSIDISDSAIDNFGGLHALPKSSVIYANNATTSISNTFINCTEDSAANIIYLENTDNAQIIGNELHLDSGSSGTGGIKLVDCSNINIDNNHIESYDRGNPIYIWDSDHVTLNDNELLSHYIYYTIFVYGDSDFLEITNNYVLSDYLSGGANLRIHGSSPTANIQIDNNIFDSNSFSFWIDGVSNLTFINNVLTADRYIGKLYMLDNNLDFNNNTLTVETPDEGDYGVFISSDYTATFKANIMDNTVNSASVYGIQIRNMPKSHIVGNTIKNVVRHNQDFGALHISECNGSYIGNNIVANVGNDGIVVMDSHNYQIEDNTIWVSNYTSSAFRAINITDCSDVIINKNTVHQVFGDGIHVATHTPLTNITISNNEITGATASSIYMANYDDIVIKDNFISSTYNGIYVYRTEDVVISGNSIGQSSTSMVIYNTDNTTVQNNIIEDSITGIWFYLSSNFKATGNYVAESNTYGILISSLSTKTTGEISTNTVTDCGYGIFLGSNINEIIVKFNLVLDNKYGFMLYSADNNIYNNSIIENNYGIYVGATATNNLIYYNDFIDNNIQAIDIGSGNEWSRETVAPEDYIGNYWSDYTGVDVDAPSGHGDTPYNVTGDIADFYPLMKRGTQLPMPVLSNPVDLIVPEGTTGHFVTWNVSSILTPLTYEIKLDGVSVYNGTITSDTVSYSIDGLALGNHTVEIIVTDSVNQEVSDTVQITVVEYDTPSSSTNETEDPLEDLFQNIDTRDFVYSGIGVGAGVLATLILSLIFRGGKGKSGKGSSKGKSKKKKK